MDHLNLLRDVASLVVFSAAATSEAIGVSYDTWRSWLTGRRNPSVKNLRSLGKFLDTRGSEFHSLAERVFRLADSKQLADSQGE